MGFEIFVVGYDADNHWYNLTDRIQLGQPGRDDDIGDFRRFLGDAARAGIHTVCYGFYTKVGQSTGSMTDRGARVRVYDQSKLKQDLLHGRRFDEEEMWKNYEYFIKQVLPVAEETGVRLALHPNDPPSPVMRGIPQIFRNNQSYERMRSITDNNLYAGIEFCVGTWGCMAGPDGKPEDVIGAVRQFGDRIYTVHFRNVNGCVPSFNETFIDNGQLDMYHVLKELKKAGFNGSMEPDHVPSFSDEKRFTNKSVIGTAYTIGYMRSLLDRVNAET
jgi:mannonate dehydratase